MIDKEKLRDYSVRPGNDFYRYACGNFQKEFMQPDDYPSWTFFDVLDEEVIIGRLREIMDTLDTSNPLQKKMSDYLSLLRDPRNQLPETMEIIRPYIERIRSFSDKEMLFEYAARKLNLMIPVDVSIVPDPENSTHYEIYLSQDLLLYNKKYYTDDDRSVYDKFTEISLNVMKMFGYEEKRASEMIGNYFKFESELIESAYTVEELDRPELNYTMMSVSEATDMFGYDIKHFLSLFDYNETDKIVVCQVEYMKRLFETFNSVALDVLKDLFEFTFILSCADSFSDEISDELWKFSQFKSGAKKRIPKWKRDINCVCYLFSDAVGKIYSERYFGSDSKERVIKMISRLKESFSEIIAEQKWMSEETKRLALEKLDAIGYSKIGFPDKWDLDFDNLEIDTSKTLFENCFSISDFLHRKMIRKYYNKDVNPEEWAMRPYTINACFCQVYPIEVCFPAGILQSPFFDKNASDAENLGSIGVIIGHEMTHGFDRNGRLFDCHGNMAEWWTPEDCDHFMENMVEPMISHFSEKSVIPFVKCNGELEVSENIADNGGLRIALNALKKLMRDKGIAGKNWIYMLREFFLSYATTWACAQTEEIAKNNNMNDEHANPVLRVNAQVQLFDEWYEAFDVGEEDTLYLEPEKRIRTW